MTHFIWISGGYVAALFDELKNILFGGSEATAGSLHAAAQNQGGPHCVLQQLHTTNLLSPYYDCKFFCFVNLVPYLRFAELK